MPGKPFQSILIPYQNEIVALRSQKPPVSYARIADLLRLKYGLIIQRAAIGKFVKARARGRKVYFFRREVAAKKPAPVAACKTEPQQPKPKFEFEYSERYNLKRLPPEEAAAIRKKLEAEGH
jgi:hypothetical protein